MFVQQAKTSPFIGTNRHACEAVVNPPGARHTADIDGRATALFITAGRGTRVRPRDGAPSAQ
jgi:hypothetical protein